MTIPFVLFFLIVELKLIESAKLIVGQFDFNKLIMNIFETDKVLPITNVQLIGIIPCLFTIWPLLFVLIHEFLSACLRQKREEHNAAFRERRRKRTEARVHNPALLPNSGKC